MNTASPSPVGMLIRSWRTKRCMSQLDLASEAEISQRHLSFVESGRSAPSRQMVLRLAEMLQVPLRERNLMLGAAGFAPAFSERSIEDPDLAPAMEAVKVVLESHEPFPSVAVDRHWNLVAHNRAVPPLFSLVSDRALLQPPVNVYRLSLHPDGLARHILNLNEWRGHLLHRLRIQYNAVADPVLLDLEKEMAAYPASTRGGPTPEHRNHPAIAVPLKLRMEGNNLSFISTITIFGTPLDVTLSELGIESLFPADAETGEFLRSVQVRGFTT